MKSFEFISEGVHDPAIFKAIFIVGGPGSGKSTVADFLTLKVLGFVNINSDTALTYLMQKNQLSLAMPPEETEKRDEVRQRAKQLTMAKMNNAIDGRLGLYIDGTGEDYNKVISLKENLEEIGYETFLVIVNASLEVALQRNLARPRIVPEDILKKKWHGVQKNLYKFMNVFTNHVVINTDRNTKTIMSEIGKAYKKIQKFSNASPRNELAKLWINKMKQL